MFELVERLNLSNNSLVALPDAIGEMACLQSLTLSNNALESLPRAIGQLKRLSLLYLQNNQLQQLPDEIGQMASLKHLILSKNKLKHLPGSLLRLPQLDSLFLDDNSLPPAPKFVSYREGKGVARHLALVMAVCEDPQLRQQRVEAERLDPPAPLVVPPAAVAGPAAASTTVPTEKKETASDRARARQDARIARHAEREDKKAALIEQQKQVLAERMKAAEQHKVAAASASPMERLFPGGADVPRATFRALLLRHCAEQKMLPVVDKAQLLAMLDAIVDDIDLDGSGTISAGVFTYALNGKSLDEWLRSALSRPQSDNNAPVATVETPLVRELSQRRVIRAATLVLCEGDAKPTLLGKGGFGAVHKLHWTGGPFNVAVKSLLATVDDPSGEVRALFEREALLQVDLTHDNILPIYGVVLDGPELGIVMPLMARSLFDAIHNGGGAAFAAAEQARIGAEIASGLTYLHSQTEPILHRDLKSLNVMLTARDEVKLVDFGLAQVKQTIQSLSTASAARSGIAVNAVGTIQWLAPELFRLKPMYSPASDIYALGVVMWELLARELPFAGVNSFVIPGAVSGGERPTMPSDAPPALAAIVNRCWAQDPSERPTALEAVRAFRCATQELPSAASPPSLAPIASAQASLGMQLESRTPTMQADDW